MKTKLVIAVIFVGLSVGAAAPALAHCEIPCGIYDDELRITLLKEHIATIEKSMDQISALSVEAEKNYNQLVRWISNKEDHAGKFMEIVTQYFMTQRIKPADPADTSGYRVYQDQLGLLHQMLVSAMNCKQTTDRIHTARLRELVDRFSAAYFGAGK